MWYAITHTQPFSGPLSRTTRVSRYQKGKPIWILLKQETVSGSGISWAICKSASRSRQITTSAPHHSVFYRPDALPAAQPTASKHWRQMPPDRTHIWNRLRHWPSTKFCQISLHCILKCLLIKEKWFLFSCLTVYNKIPVSQLLR